MTAACSEGRGALKKHESMELINSEAFRDTAPNTVRFFYFAESCGLAQSGSWFFIAIRCGAVRFEIISYGEVRLSKNLF